MGGRHGSPSVLVTGASGFLGSHAVAEFTRHGYRVIAAGRRENALPAESEMLTRFVGDLDALAEARITVDAVVHCAARSTPWGRWRDFEHDNVKGTRSAYVFARRNGAQRFVHVSSPSIYAAPRDRLQIREADVDLENRLNGYIRSKIAAETWLRGKGRRPGDPEVVVLRPRGLIGAGDPSLAPRLLAVHARMGVPIFRGGGNLIDLTSVENAAEALRLAVESPRAAGETFNISNGDPRPFRDLVETLVRHAGESPRLRRLPRAPVYAAAALAEAIFRMLPGNPEPALTRYTLTTIAYAQTLDISHARRVLGYTPTVSIDDSLRAYARG